MQPISCQHREQLISKWNYEITVVQEYGSLNFFLFLQKSIYLGFGIEVWLIPFGII
jgi:hypothetical protein